MSDLISREYMKSLGGACIARRLKDGDLCPIISIDLLPSVQPEKKWETCFDCPLSHGCPKINGCTNGQIMEYASEVPDDCPISVQPRKGKWIYGESEIGNDGYYCSVCGNFVPWKYDEYDIDFIKEFLFCNKCGADMRGDRQ